MEYTTEKSILHHSRDGYSALEATLFNAQLSTVQRSQRIGDRIGRFSALHGAGSRLRAGRYAAGLARKAGDACLANAARKAALATCDALQVALGLTDISGIDGATTCYGELAPGDVLQRTDGTTAVVSEVYHSGHQDGPVRIRLVVGQRAALRRIETITKPAHWRVWRYAVDLWELGDELGEITPLADKAKAKAES